MGEWKAGSFNGWGIYKERDGTSYLGQFKNDKRHGKGFVVQKEQASANTAISEPKLTKWEYDKEIKS